MFYVKAKLTEEAEINIELNDENVFTRCIGCGEEIQVDIQEECRSDYFDLLGTSMYCTECSQKIRKERGIL